MKKTISLILASALVLSLSSCSSNTGKTDSYELSGEAKKAFETLKPDDRADDLLQLFATLDKLHYEDAETLKTELQSVVDTAEKYSIADDLNAKTLLENPSEEKDSPSLSNFQETGLQLDKEKIFYSILPDLYADKTAADKTLNGEKEAIIAAAEAKGYELTTGSHLASGLLKDNEASSYKSFSFQWDKDSKLVNAVIVAEHLDLVPELEEEFKQFGPPEQLEKTAGNHAVWLSQLTVSEHPVLSQIYSVEEQATLQEFFQKVDSDYIYEKSEIDGQLDGYPVLDWSINFAGTVLNFNGPVYELTITVEPADFGSSSYQMGLVELEKAFVGGETYQNGFYTAALDLEDELKTLKAE